MKRNVGGISLNLLETGTGEPALLFLHYWGGSARTWNAVTANLAGDFRCVAYDQRGWGSPTRQPTDIPFATSPATRRTSLPRCRSGDMCSWGIPWGGKSRSYWRRSGPESWRASYWLHPRRPHRKTCRKRRNRRSFMRTIIAKMLFRRWRFSPRFRPAAIFKNKSFPTVWAVPRKPDLHGPPRQSARTFQRR